MNRITALKLKLNNLSLGSKIITIFLGSILIVSLVFGLAFKTVLTLNHRMLYQSVAGSLSYSSHEIETILSSVEDASLQIFANPAIQADLKNLRELSMVPESGRSKDEQNAGSLSRKNIYSLLTDYLGSNDYMTYVSIVTDDLSITASSYQSGPPRTGPEPEQMQEKAAARQGQAVWISSAPDGLYLVRTIREINGLSLQPLGTLIIQIDLDRLVTDSTRFSSLFEASTILLLSPEGPLYSPPGPACQLPAAAFYTDSEYELTEWNGERFFIVTRPVTAPALSVACLVPYNQVFDPLVRTYGLTFFAIALTVALVVLISLFLIRSILKHFRYLIVKIDAFDGSSRALPVINYDYTARRDELGLLHRHFDLMAAKIDGLIKENYLKQIHLKEAQIKTLETQINPHFLYNTLNTINWKARLAGEHEISGIVEALSSLLRSALKEDTGVHPIRDELTLVENYITIQRSRFGSRLHFHSAVDPELINMPIPRMTIQPLVENAIKYSVEVNTDDTDIFIEIVSDNNRILIYVKNDGSQFTDKPYDKKPEGSGIGLVNINTRIKLMFGDAYGLTLYNEEELAVALITIPYGGICG